jgi:hypothetical protein
MPRSLGTGSVPVYGGSVTRFLGGGLRGVVSRVIHTPGVASSCNGIAVSRDGCTLLLGSARFDGSHGIHELDVASGCTLRVVGDCGMPVEPLQFNDPSGLCIASDAGFVFVADSFTSRVQVLTPQLQLQCVIGSDACLNGPAGVCRRRCHWHRRVRVRCEARECVRSAELCPADAALCRTLQTAAGRRQQRASDPLLCMAMKTRKRTHHITSHHITSHHITSHHITSHHITSHHITSHHTRPLSHSPPLSLHPSSGRGCAQWNPLAGCRVLRLRRARRR